MRVHQFLFLYSTVIFISIGGVMGSSTSTTATAAAVGSLSALSSSRARLPGAVSSVLNDLEAEGVQNIATVALLTSRSVSQAARAQLVKHLFATDAGADVTAVAVKSVPAEESEEVGIGIALATPAFSVSEAATAVQACAGTVLFVVDWQDVQRGEGVFDLLVPAMERRTSGTPVDAVHHPPAQLIVLFVGLPPSSLAMATKLFQQAAVSSLAQFIPHPSSTLEELFTSGVYYRDYSTINSFNDLIRETPSIWMDLSTAIQQITRSTTQQDFIGDTAKILNTSPADLAAVRRLLPISRQAFQLCLDTISQTAEITLDPSVGFKNMKPIDSFGELADAAVKRSLELLDNQVNTLANTVAKSTLARRIRSNLITDMHSTIIQMYESQLEQLHLASMESFKAGLSKLRISPNLGSDMNQVAKMTIQSFLSASKKLLPKSLSTTSLAVPSANLLSEKLAKDLREFIALRLLAARADGKFRPLPRKGVTLGFHWLLPKPFGNDYRQEPWKIHTSDDLIYVPNDKITDVSKKDIIGSVEGEDWTSKVLPCPSANEMIYMK